MSSLNDLQRNYDNLGVIEDLTEAMEGIASYRIRQVKTGVLSSKAFFQELWGIYQSLRIDKPVGQAAAVQTKDLFIVITSSAGLTGDIDEAITRQVVADYVADTTDVIVIGLHGAALLKAHGIKPIKVFNQPDIGKPINASPIVEYVPKYRRTQVFYQEFESLTVQRVGKIELILEAQALGKHDLTTIQSQHLIIADSYIFEPDQSEVVDYLEHVMLGVALTQMILESQLAQFAARFTSMLTANERAKDARREAYLGWLAARRRIRDEDAHEIIYAMGANR